MGGDMREALVFSLRYRMVRGQLQVADKRRWAPVSTGATVFLLWLSELAVCLRWRANAVAGAQLSRCSASAAS